MTLTPRELLEQDQALEAREAALSLPDGDAEGSVVRENTDYLASLESYQEYYRTMRGGICPEAEVFTRHHFVQRFASIRRLILERKHKTVLDLGCLDGWQLLNLAAHGITGVGVDLCPQTLAIAGERAAKWGFDLKFIESGIEDFEYGYYSDLMSKNGFDAVILSEVLEHVLDPLACMKTAARHLAQGGIVYISVPASTVPHHGKLEDAREHLRVFREEQLVDLAKEAGLAVVQDHETIKEEDCGEPFSHRMISFRRARITIYCNHVTGGWSPERIEECGASEEMVVKVAEMWALQGHEVAVHQNGFEGQINGVSYLPRAIVPKPDQDLLVLFKTTDYSDRPARAKIFWTTDLPQPGQAAVFLPPLVVENLDAVVGISEYHRAELLKACPWLDPTKAKAHWLGIEQEAIVNAFKELPHGKQSGRIVYASSPDRGLSQLLDIWPRVVEQAPQASLHVLYGFDFWEKSEAVLPVAQAEEMRKERERLTSLLNTLPNISFRGRTSRSEYLTELAQAEIWAYPCTGGELCCKTALEMQAGHCLPVVIPTMALNETVQVGYKAEDLQSFEAALVTALAQHTSWQWDNVKLPSWEDLATFLWESSLKMAHRENSLGPVATLPTEVGATEETIPEHFEYPRRTGALSARTSLDIVMAVAGMPFDGNTDRERGLGGSETAALQLAREMVKLGHRVSVFSNLPGQSGKFDGVSYLPISEWGKYASSACHDVSIVQREPMAFNQQLRSKLNVLWCHDLGLLRHRSTFRSSLWNVDYVVPVSHWHGRQLCQVYDLPPSLIAPMYNGIDLGLIAQATKDRRVRERNALVYASRPERGLDLLLQSIFPRLLERDPELTLYVAGYENTVPEMEPFYQHCRQLMANFGPRAKWLGGLSKPDLYRLYSRATCMTYPSRNFDEVFCITAAEAAACGLPFIGTTLGALPEVTKMAPNFASLVEHPGEANEQFITAYVDEVWRILSDDLALRRMSEAGKCGASAYSWDKVAEEWESFLIGALEQRSENRQRLVRHWWRLGDLNGIASLSDEDQQLLSPHQQEELKMARHDDSPSVVPNHVIQAVGQMAADAKARTVYSISGNFSSEVAGMANALSAEDPPAIASADFVFGVETLDCSRDPISHIRDVERLVKPGGYACLVVASPGVQQERLFNGAKRRRRWVFDNHDMQELLGGKLDLLSIIIGGGALSECDKSPLSWMLYRWKITGVQADQKSLDAGRRMRLQAPKPSLSACLIVKNAEDMLHRCLKSIEPHCDEIIADDNGSTDSTKEILQRHGIELQIGPSPLEVGFDEARNQGLKRATGDFVLWMDSDEELLNGFNLPKYLRWSMYDGFGVAQHHFSADPPNVFKPDLPVRVFRRVNVDGTPTKIRFWGFVHEHPEKAINHSVGQSVVLSDVHLAHDGYLTEYQRRKRFDRNIPLMFRDRIKYPDRVLGKFLMIRDWCHMARYSIERNGGGLTPEAVHFLEAAIESYRRDFLGMTHVMAADGLQYYNEALQVLNRGFEVQVVLKVGGLDGAPHEINYAGRVASQEDLERLVKGGISDLTLSWKGKYL